MITAQLILALRDHNTGRDHNIGKDVIDGLKSLRPDDKSDALEDQLVETLKRSDDPRVRNAAAIASLDIESTRALDHVRNLLSCRRTVGSRGTLLYVLRAAGIRLSLREVTDLLNVDSVEVCEGAFDFLESYQIEPPSDDDLRSGIARLESAKHESAADKRDLLKDAIAILSKALREGLAPMPRNKSQR